jgi:RNA polymerase sigma factor (sigma-70 family)
MNPDSAFFEDLLDGLRCGDATAATVLFARYSERLIGLARKRLDGRTRQKVDPEDVVQSVFRSFFRRQAQGQVIVADGDALWSLLAVITARKCANRVRFFRAACRNVYQENEASTDVSAAVAGADPSPQEAALLEETLQRLMSNLDARERDILTLALQGYSPREIAEQVQRSERTVQVLLHNVRRRLVQWQRDADAPEPTSS